MDNNLICARCGKDCDATDDPCEALKAITKLYTDLRTEEKTQLIRVLRKYLNLIDCEVAEDLKELGERVINRMPELFVIRDYDVKIGYVRSYEAKRDKGKIVSADCRKVRGTFTAYLPFDFVVTFYEPNVYHLTENQRKILMLHELRHIGIGERGLRIENHDVEDFRDILERFGIDWNGFDQEVADILAGGDGVKKPKEKRKKKQGMEAPRKTNKNG
ncbi:hypothetical protein JCM15765_04040 [Paradesulfitobacterium aromaticivorans]